MAFGLLKKIGGDIAHKAKNTGISVARKTRDAGGDAVKKAGQVGHKSVDKVKDVGGKVGGDIVRLSSEAVKGRVKREKNFANGLLDWGKDTVGTTASLVSHPGRTVKAVDKLAKNPVFNPIGGTTNALLRGKNPVKAYKEGLGDAKKIGGGLLEGYKQTYKKHGAAGVAGRLAPDIAIAIATGGAGTVAKTGTTVTAKAAVKEGASDAVQTTAKTTTAKDIGKELAPGPEDVISAADKAEHPFADSNFFEAFLENFSL